MQHRDGAHRPAQPAPVLPWKRREHALEMRIAMLNAILTDERIDRERAKDATRAREARILELGRQQGAAETLGALRQVRALKRRQMRRLVKKEGRR